MRSTWLDETLRARFPAWDRLPRILRTGILATVRGLTRMGDIEALLTLHAEKRGVAFVDHVFEDLDFACSVSSDDKARIPAKGRLIIVANHPLGAMDALALLRIALDVRSDVRVVANELLMEVGSLAGHLVPLDMFSTRPRKSNLVAIGSILEQQAALIMFPSGDVSCLTMAGLRDRSWLRGAVHLAQKYNAPVLPVFITGRNARLFYVVSFFSRRLAVLLLPRQIFYQRGRTILLRIGDPIPARMFAGAPQIEALREHIYQLAQQTTNVKSPTFGAA